jgi:hypothetical protein
MAPRKTRKQAKSRSASIPALKQSFDSLNHAVNDILRSPASSKQRVKKFQEVWRRIFGRPVDAAAAEAYLKVKSRGHSRKQRGGALAGAPVDFQVRPGVDGVHGSFNPYVGSGLGFGNTVNQPGLFQSCGTENITPSVSASMGSNAFMKGGRRKHRGGGIIQAASDALFTLSTRPIAASPPTTGLVLMQDTALGRPQPAPAAPEQNPGLFGRVY